MDNFHIDITSEGIEEFDQAMKIAFNHAPGKKTTHYSIDPEKGFILFWGAPANGTTADEFPFPLSHIPATALLWQWLITEAEYGREPDHDGDNEKGWRVYNEDWGMIGNHRYSFVAIQPVWAMYGK
jgi:hypothetical protein